MSFLSRLQSSPHIGWFLSLFLLLGTWFTPSNAQAEAQWVSTPDLTHIPHWTVPLESKADWLRSSSPYADIYASVEDEAVAHDLMRHAHTAIPRIAKQLGVSTGGAMQIYLANTQAEFQAMQPHAPPDWADGTAWPKNGWIFLRSPRIRPGLAEPLHQVLDHEIVHILLGRAFAHYPVPRWLQEGVAQVVAGEYTPSKVQQLGTFAEPMSFLELAKGFPADALRARMAYAQSASLVAYLFQEHGTQSLQILIEEMSQGRELDVALVRATGMTPQELDVAWRGRTLSMPLWLQSVSIDGTLLAIVALVILLGSTRKYKQYRQGNHLWDEEERVHQQLIQEMSTWDRSMRI
jgi:hypothetical protein